MCYFLTQNLSYFKKMIQVLESAVDTEHVQLPKVWVDVKSNQKESQV